MRPDHALARLQHHQDQIARLLGEVRPLLQQGDASQHKALGLARWQLLRLLREYQLFKHTEIFDPIIGTGDDRRAASAELLKQGCIAIAAAFNEHVQRWSLVGLAGSWSSYRSEALVMADRIDRHLLRELGDIQGLLSGLERTRHAHVDARKA